MESVDLNIPELQGQDNVLFAFVSVNGYGNNLYVDNINIQVGSTTTPPAGTVAIKEANWLNSISLYPNPTYEYLQIDLSLKSKDDIRVEVFNTLGQLMIQKDLLDFTSGVETINLQQASSGVYYVRVSNNSASKIVRFLKKN